jgi:threonine dehydratase
MLDLTADELARGVTGVSAGNHAISLGYCARELGTTATVVMPRTANPYRIALCKELGATVELVDTVHDAFTRVHEIVATQGRTFVHPYEGPRTALGTATVGLEFVEQLQHEGAQLDAVIVAAGGGGLTGGVACAVKQLSPHTAVYVVEPEGADTMYRSFAAGSPQSIDKVRTIADSLGAPRCEPYSYALNRQFVDDVVLVTDEHIRDAMRLTFRAAKLVTEPAGSAALAALLGGGGLHAQDVQPVPALTARVIDTTGTLAAAEREALEQRLATFEAQAGPQIVLLMVATTAPEDIAAYAQRVANRISRACGRSMEACRVASLTLPAEPADDPSPGSTR